MRTLITLTLLCICAQQLPAQKSFKKTTLYGEIAGNGLVLSVNYERQLGNKPGFGLHAGIGLGGEKPAIPLGVIYLLDLGSDKSFVELGFGATLTEPEFIDNTNKYDEVNEYRPVHVPSIGYRHHTHYGLMWKLIYSPVVSKYRNLGAWGGFSIGWRL